MGRAFEYRKARKLRRWSAMSKAFTKLGREIVLAVKAGGSDPASNNRLRAAIQTARSINMPKDNIDAAIKRACNKEEKEMVEIVYEGMGPHGISFMVETATDNPNRTVADLRVIFSRNGGALGTSNSVAFMFNRKAVFKFSAEGQNLEELELELIDFGAEDIIVEDGEITVYTDFTDFGKMQKALEDRKINLISADLQRIPTIYKDDLTDEQAEDVIELIEKLEDNDDVQAVFHNFR
jgi:YebC/PmpR family DNA-binding regulatory protein